MAMDQATETVDTLALALAPDAARARDTPVQCAAPARLGLGIVSSRAGFHALEAEWTSLFERAGQPQQVFLQYNWLWHWLEHFFAEGQVADRSLLIITGRIAGRLSLVLPLLHERRLGVGCIGWMGDPVSQYGDVLMEDGPEADRLLELALDHIRLLGADLLHLRKVRADSRLAPMLQKRGAQITDCLEAPCLDLCNAPDYASYERRYDSRERKNRRRQRRRLAEQGVLSSERHREDPGHGQAVAGLIAMKQAQLRSRGKLSRAYSNDGFARFMTAVATAAERPVGFRLAQLKLDGSTVAGSISFVAKGHCAAHVTVYDPAFERCGPGSLLLEDSLKASMLEGVSTYDLLAPGAAYKRGWADRSVAVCDYAMPLTARGRLYQAGYISFVYRGTRQIAERLPPPLGRLAMLLASLIPVA